MTPDRRRGPAPPTGLDRPWLRLAAWAAFLVLSLRLLHGETFGSLSIPLSSPDEVTAWTERTSPVVMALAVVRLAALAAAWYLTAATILTAVAAVTRWRPLAAVAVRVSPEIVRRLVCRSASAGLAVGALLAVVPVSPRLAASPVVAEVASPNDDPATTATVGPSPTATMTRQPNPPLAREPDLSPGPATGERWVVEAGDSFWSIAEETLAADGPVSPSDVARVCDRLIAANRDRLIDRDNPDLLVPGQELSIPRS